MRTSNELTYFVRSDVAWRIDGIIYADPSPEQLRKLTSGRDCAFLSPCRSKTDVGGVEWAPFPSILPYDASLPTNAAAALLDLELNEPCHAGARDRTPLYADARGEPYTHGVLDAWLHRVLAALYDEPTACVHSWHSLRIGLACALAAADVPDAHIQLICRWASADSLKTYRRLGVERNVAYTDAAERAVVDTMQSGNIPIIDSSRGFALLQEEANSRRCSPSARFSRAPSPLQQTTTTPRIQQPADHTAPSPATPPLPSRPKRLVPGEAVGRIARVPRRCWPSYACHELNGRGWQVSILDERTTSGRPEALVAFSSARSANGAPYQPVWLALRVLSPM